MTYNISNPTLYRFHLQYSFRQFWSFLNWSRVGVKEWHRGGFTLLFWTYGISPWSQMTDLPLNYRLKWIGFTWIFMNITIFTLFEAHKPFRISSYDPKLMTKTGYDHLARHGGGFGSFNWREFLSRMKFLVLI